MASRSAFEKAEMFDLTREQVIILFYITAWFNLHTREIRGKEVSIASAKEPTLRQLCGDDWEPGFDAHHEQLVQRGLLREDTGDGNVYVGGNRCEWLPTRDGMTVIEELFKHRDDIYPPWVTDQHSRPPIFRDGEELLEHRKGTMVARFTFLDVTGYVTGADVYPRFSNPNRPDLRLWRKDKPLAYVETQTDHNNAESRVNKFNHWTESSAPPVIWIYPNRTVMVEMWNRLVVDGHATLDGGLFNKPANNWSPQRVNNRLQRSGLDHSCWTIGGLLQAPKGEAFEFLDENNIILDS